MIKQFIERKSIKRKKKKKKKENQNLLWSSIYNDGYIALNRISISIRKIIHDFNKLPMKECK